MNLPEVTSSENACVIDAFSHWVYFHTNHTFMKKPTPISPEEFMDITTIGERGQIVIPKELREAYGLTAGMKLVIMKHEKNGPMVLFPVEQMRTVVQKMTSRLAKLDLSSKK